MNIFQNLFMHNFILWSVYSMFSYLIFIFIFISSVNLCLDDYKRKIHFPALNLMNVTAIQIPNVVCCWERNKTGMKFVSLLSCWGSLALSQTLLHGNNINLIAIMKNIFE